MEHDETLEDDVFDYLDTDEEERRQEDADELKLRLALAQIAELANIRAIIAKA